MDALGRAFVIVGTNERSASTPLVTVESPLDVHVDLAPRTRKARAAPKRQFERDGYGEAYASQTNVITNATARPLTDAMVIDLLQKVWENGGIQVSETATLMCDAWQKFTSTRYPQRVVHDLGVTCVDGGVAVSDKNVIEARCASCRPRWACAPCRACAQHLGARPLSRRDTENADTVSLVRPGSCIHSP